MSRMVTKMTDISPLQIGKVGSYYSLHLGDACIVCKHCSLKTDFFILIYGVVIWVWSIHCNIL